MTIRLLAALLSLLLAGPGVADEASPSARTVEGELARLSASVEQSNLLLERILAQQEASLLLGRLELASARLEDWDRRVDAAKERAAEMRLQEERLRGGVAQLETERDQAASTETTQRLEAMAAQLGGELEAVRKERRRLELEQVDLLAESDRRRDRLVELEELLDSRIERLARTPPR
jgi:predicted  nucleic acid-binding Zn-ribbon protein